MKSLFLKVILAYLITAFSGVSFAQNTGYAGKRVMINIDAISGSEFPRYGGSVQFLLSRSSTVSLGFGIHNKSVNQRYLGGQFADDHWLDRILTDHVINNPYQSWKYDLSDLGRIETKSFSIEYNFYPDHRVFPAPRGFFLSVGLQYYSSAVSGNYYKSLISPLNVESNSEVIDITNCYTCSSFLIYEPDEYYRYTYGNVKSLGAMGGMGYTYFITSRLTATASLYLHYMNINYDQEYSDKVLSGIMKNNFGPNLYYPEETKYSSQTMGISGFIKIGYLVF